MRHETSVSVVYSSVRSSMSPSHGISTYLNDGMAASFWATGLEAAGRDGTDPLIELYDATGALVLFDDDSGGRFDARGCGFRVASG